MTFNYCVFFLISVWCAALAIWKTALSAICSCKGWRFQELLDEKHLSGRQTPYLFFIIEFDESEVLRILLVWIVFSEFNHSICQYILWQPAPPFTAFVLQILLGSHNKERFMLMYFEKFLECIVSTVKYIESLCLWSIYIKLCAIQFARFFEQIINI